MFNIWNKDEETHTHTHTLDKTQVGDVYLQCNFPSGTNHIKIKKIFLKKTGKTEQIANTKNQKIRYHLNVFCSYAKRKSTICGHDVDIDDNDVYYFIVCDYFYVQIKVARDRMCVYLSR